MSSNDHFHFPRKQRSGIILLVILIVTGLLSWRIISALKPSSVQAAAPVAGNRSHPVQEQHAVPEKSVTDEKQLSPASFDPNTAGEAQLVAAGLPLRTARTLIKYRSKGGRFYKKEDLLKLYTMSREDYNRIEKYIHIATVPAPQQHFSSRKTTVNTIDLNHADADALIALRGIGPGYAKRLLGYREKLGGFTNTEQLKEVYGFPDSTYRQLEPRLRVNPSDVKKLNINTASEEELARHPYIRTALAASIIKLRNDLKKFRKTEELRQLPLINEEKYRKIAPYLSVD